MELQTCCRLSERRLTPLPVFDRALSLFRLPVLRTDEAFAALDARSEAVALMAGTGAIICFVVLDVVFVRAHRRIVGIRVNAGCSVS